MATSNLILQSFLKTAPSKDKKNTRSYNKKVQELFAHNKAMKGEDFLTPLNYYLDILEGADQVLLPYMSPEKKQLLLRELQVTFLLLLTQRKYELDHQKTENYKTYTNHIKKCNQLIYALQYEQVCIKTNTQPAPEHGYASESNPVKYLFISLGQWFAEKITAFMDRKTKATKDAMGAFNEKRLYWVWGSSLIKVMLDSLSKVPGDLDDANQTIRYPDPYTGTISWALYYFRCALNLSLLLKHTLSGPWMSEVEKQTPWTERFSTQWAQRKFTILNDFVWATGNLLCFFWLTGQDVMGTWGDLLTLALLVFDIGLAVWEFVEEETKYNAEMLGYDNDIAQLKDLIIQSKSEDDVKEYRLQLNALERARKKCKANWDDTKLSLIINISYAVGLMIAFFLLATPFVPALAFLAPTGAVLCFALTVLYNGVKGKIELDKTTDALSDMNFDLKNKIAEFKLLNKYPDTDDNAKKLLFLEIKQLLADTQYQKQMVNLQTALLIRSIIFESVIPAIILINLVLFPVALLPAIYGVLALSACTYLAINLVFGPDEKKALKPLNEKEYTAFCKNPDDWSKNAEKSPGFFKAHEKETPRNDQDDESDFDMTSLFPTSG